MTLPDKVEEEDDRGFRDFQLASSQEPAVIRQRNFSDNPSQGIKYPILIKSRAFIYLVLSELASNILIG